MKLKTFFIVFEGLSYLIKKLKFNKKQRTQALKTFASLSRKADEKEKEKKTRIAIAKLFALNANTIKRLE